MKLPPRQLLYLAAFLAFFLPGHTTWSQTTRIIKIVVPNPPGGPGDTLARLLAEQIGSAHGTTVVIENRPGANAIIGTEAVARAAPDGNTLLITAPPFVITPHLRKANYDPLTSFEPICQLVSSPVAIVVNSASPYRTLADLLNAARAKPGALTVAGTGQSAAQIGFEMLKRAANVDMTFVPYPGNAPVITALLGGHVTAAYADYATLAQQLGARSLRSLATPSRTRIEFLPEVPTVAESGYKDTEVEFWIGLVAPAKTPKHTVSQLAGWFAAATQAPDVRLKLVSQGFLPVGTCGADFAALIQKQYDVFGRVIREANIRAD
jgi:tripartite-type tricarboxylate transporter receptor subunit TctC